MSRHNCTGDEDTCRTCARGIAQLEWERDYAVDDIGADIAADREAER